MKMIKGAVAAVAAALVFGLSLAPALAGDGARTVSKSAAAFKAINADPKKGIPPALFKDVKGVAIFPGLSKLDFMVSGRAGEGVVLVRGSDGKWGSPLFVSINGGTLGWQIVGEPMDIVLVFKDRQDLGTLMKEKLTLVGKATPVTGPLGATLKGASEAELKAGINSYVFSHGGAADVALATSVVQPSGAANDGFYGGKKVSAGDILSGKLGKPSAEVGALQKLLSDFAARK